jgi:hypothetical protein
MDRTSRQLLFQRDIEIVDFGALQLLQPPVAERWRHVTPEQFLVSLQSSPVDQTAAPCPVDVTLMSLVKLQPSIDPLRNRHLVRFYVITGMTRLNKAAQFLASCR